jgi:L-ascorbate metabolism protein UlaG (beta-lactamase superfamily)
MRRFVWLSLLLGLLLPAAHADDKKKNAAYTPPPMEVHWYGHAFIYITSTTGVRIAIDPWSEDSSVTYKFPTRLPADVVLVSSETPDHNGSIRLFGSPQVFSSVTAIGLNNARGLMFRGVQTYRDKSKGAQRGTNSVFTFKLDGIRFCHLGALGHVLDTEQKAEIGQVDVLFLPVGNPDLTPTEILKMAHDLGAKIIVPIKYKNQWSQDLNLRPLSEFMAAVPPEIPSKDLQASSFTITPEQIPPSPTIYLLTPDQDAAPASAAPTAPAPASP